MRRIFSLFCAIVLIGCTGDPKTVDSIGGTTSLDGGTMTPFSQSTDSTGGVSNTDVSQGTTGTVDSSDDTDNTDGGTVGNDSTNDGVDGGVTLSDSTDSLDDTSSSEATDASDSTDSAVATDTMDSTDGADNTDNTSVSTTGSDAVHTLYPTNQIHSPMSPNVVKTIQEISALNPDLKSNVFMKVGASSTVSSYNLKCFAGSSVDLDVDQPDLQSGLDHYLSGDAAGTTPYERKTKAAKSGMSAGWAIKGNPAPVESEIDEILPSSAIVHYGANDMGMGSTYESALFVYADKMLTLTDLLIDNGIVPVLMTITPRKDAPKSNLWIPSYNTVVRAIAQGRQVPLVDLFLAVQDIEGYGLAGDGLHLNVYKQGNSAKPCVMTDAGLGYGFNVRNLISLQALNNVYLSTVEKQAAPDPAIPMSGDGSLDSPYVINSLPFTDLRDTSKSANSNLSVYSGCAANQDESGPEYMYELTLTETTSLRAMVFDQGSVDVDLHLLDNTASEAGCIERAHQIIETTLAPGTYYFSLDSFVNANGVNSGEYLFVVLPCHPDDNSCAN